ncbi:exonuclease SbcCD subunit D [Virgibacillus alimentarius]|uniref:exonuclease SbcCD subunit D n=1 Tax=Virgibacillus alimentarius TaxID=698769 RepID=UPI000492EF34|nr:exonuclease SbcCD subunit D [Virgibacillus alimentarius]
MKILHTADWHLGKIVNNVHMTGEQEFILTQFLQIVKNEKPDAVIIAGDIYDRAVPPKEAVELLNHILTSLITELKTPVLAIAGNHDSPDRLEFGNQLFRTQNLYIETKLRPDLQPIILNDEYGPVYFHLIPYIEPSEARVLFQDESIHSHQSAMEKIIGYIKENNDMNERHIFVGHAFLAGGMESESEERLSMIGGTPYIDASLFYDFTYVAMGHLHQAQRVKSDVIRYSGSILKYSFSEANHKKSVTMIDLDKKGNCQLEMIPLIPKHDMKVIEGYFEELLEHPIDNHMDFLHIRLLDTGEIIDPMNKLRSVYPNILRLERKGLSSKTSLLDLQKIQKRQSQSHTELFSSFYEEIKGVTISEEKIQQINHVISKVLERERGE